MKRQYEHSVDFLSFVRGGLLAAIAGGTGIVHAQADLDPPDAVAMMSVGDGTTCAALVDGRAKCWGQGDDGGPADAPFIAVGGPVQAVHTNGRQSFALLHGGTVRAWGVNDGGQLGLGHHETPTQAPADVELGGVAIELAVGDGFACSLLEGAAVRCWGANDVGQLGLGHTAIIGDDETPAESGVVPLGGIAVGLVAGAHHACARLADGTARCWGANDGGQLGLGHTEIVGDDETPSRVRPIAFESAVVELAAGESHTCARLITGAVRCWGANDAGQLGLGHTESIGDDERLEPMAAVALGGSAIALAAGARHTCAILDDGGLVCWGEGLDGRLGLGHEDDVGSATLPVSAGAVDLADRSATRVFIGATGSSTCATLDGGSVRCWGLNDVGQLGLGHTIPVGATPTTTPGQLADVIVANDGDD